MGLAVATGAAAEHYEKQEDTAESDSTTGALRAAHTR